MKDGNFFYQLARRLFDKHLRATAIIICVHSSRCLKAYSVKVYPRSTTLSNAFHILTELIHQHGDGKVKGVPIDAVRKLAGAVDRRECLCP